MLNTRLLAIVLLATAAVACRIDPLPPRTNHDADTWSGMGTGGAGTTSSGGTTGTAGETATGGANTSAGGMSSAGGAANTGGTKATGGIGSTGGTMSIRGTSTAGGATKIGGMTGTAGSSTTGGASAAGGAKAAGGIGSTGGNTSMGGTTSAGGAIPTGGTPATGGASTIGGTSAAGGAKATGGIGSTGGNTSMGGTTSAGGAIPTGGTPATGGASTIGGTSAAGGTTSTGGAAGAGAGTSGQGSWVKIDSASPQHAQTAVAYDPVLQRAVLFGGNTTCATGAAATTNLTWEWDGKGWTLVTPTGDIPSARMSIAMAFDRVHGEAIVHGGWTPPDKPQAGTYTYNLATHVWTYRGANLFNIGCYAIGYDTDAQLVRMFGGNIYSTFYRDLRSWDESTQTWSSVAPAGPSARITAWAYDQAHQRFVMFGGLNDFSGFVLSDTWEYNPTATTWQQTATTTDHPASNTAMIHEPVVYDPKRAVTVMYLPTNGGETWEYNAGTHLWTKVVGANQIGATSEAVVFYDEKLEAVLLVGGCAAGALQNGTWQYIPFL